MAEVRRLYFDVLKDRRLAVKLVEAFEQGKVVFDFGQAFRPTKIERYPTFLEVTYEQVRFGDL
jgi:hypothetical protein